MADGIGIRVDIVAELTNMVTMRTEFLLVVYFPCGARFFIVEVIEPKPPPLEIG
jgi:hypothetical protein